MRIVLPLLLLLCLLAACAEEPPTSQPPVVVIPGPGETVVYSRHIAPIFRTSCAGADCHMDGEGGGGLSLNTWAETMQGSSTGGASVIPYSSRQSHLFQHINEDTALSAPATPRMPLSLDPLPVDQIMAIRRWIDEGARNDDGTVALAGENRPRLFLATRYEGLLAVVDRTTGLIARYMPLGRSPVGGGTLSMVTSPDGRYLYAALPGTGTIVRYDTRTLAISGMADVGGSPGQIVLSSDGTTLYAGNFLEESNESWVACVDATTMQPRQRIENVGRAPYGVALVPGGQYLVTVNTLSDDLSLVDRATCQVVKRMIVSRNNPLIPGFFARYRPYGALALNDGRTLLVTCRRNGELRTFDLVEGVVTDSLFVGQQPGVPVLTPDGREVWIPDPALNAIIIVDPATRRKIATIPDIGGAPNSVAFSADGRTAYVTCSRAVGAMQHGQAVSPGSVYVIDVASRVEINRIEVGAGAEGVAVVR